MNSTNSGSNKPLFDATVPENELRLEWGLRVFGRQEIIAKSEGMLPFPLGLHPKYFGQAAIDLAKMVDMLIARPVETMVHIKVRELEEAELQARVADIQSGVNLAADEDPANFVGGSKEWYEEMGYHDYIRPKPSQSTTDAPMSAPKPSRPRAQPSPPVNTTESPEASGLPHQPQAKESKAA